MEARTAKILKETKMNKVRVDELLAVSWSGSFGAIVLTHISTVATILCVVLSALASIYAIRVSRSTMRLHDLDAEMKKVDMARRERDLCDQCKAGDPPNVCPIPKHEQPENCPRRTIEEKPDRET